MVPCALYATLFPYTTLFRSGRAVKFFLEDECGVEKGNWQKANASQKEAVALLSGKSANQEKLNGHKHARFGLRSEEHTSELQSRGHLVCRLLLDKKKHYSTL